MNKSPIDNLFFSLYGYYPTKAGQAYELITNAAIKLVYGEDVDYNINLAGDYSKTMYQLDGLVNSDIKNMIEAKDYTIDNRKVGRPDVQKLQGAITDLNVDGGIFASATNFTKPAKNYANSSKINPLQKEIQLVHIRPSTEEDEKNVLQRIQVIINMNVPLLKEAKYDLILASDASTEFFKKCNNDEITTLNVSEIYDKHGNVLTTIRELSKNPPLSATDEKVLFVNGTWIIRDGYLKIDKELYAIKGITYNIPFKFFTKELIIEMEGTYKIYFKNEDGSIDKLLTDADLKKIKFENGKVIKKEAFDI